MCICRAANGEEDCIELVLDLVLALLEDHHLFPLGVLADADRHCFLEEFYALILHVFSDFVGYLLVEASQEYGSDHNGNISSQGMQEPSTLKSDIRCSHYQGLPWIFLEPEDIIGRN